MEGESWHTLKQRDNTEVTQHATPVIHIVSTTVKDLSLTLKECGLPVEEYGKGCAKNVSDLVQEIELDETRLCIMSTGKLIREVLVVGAIVQYTDLKGATYTLRESHQEFSDGRIKIRQSSFAVSEKRKTSEHPIDAIQRGIREELHIPELMNLTHHGTWAEARYSESYPGLCSIYTIDGFHADIDHHFYQEEGYVEEQSTKKTFFVWEKE